jgi:hypothetical protein
LADCRATRTYIVDHPTPRPPTRLEEPNRKPPTTWSCLELDQGHQVHTSTRRDHTTMMRHRNTAPTAMGHMGANSPLSGMCKRGETRESRELQHSLNNKATRALPQTFSLRFTRLHWHLQEFIIFGTCGGIFCIPVQMACMDTPIFDTLTSLLMFDCLKPVILELSCSGIVAQGF